MKQTQIDWRDLTIGRALKEAAVRWRNNEALVSKGRRLSYSELFDAVCKLAMGISKLGIKKGDSVATIFGIVPEWVYLQYALSIVGAKIIPINTNLKPREIEFILRKADVNALMITDKIRETNYLQYLSEIDPHIIGTNTNNGYIHSDALPLLRYVICFSQERQKHPNCYDFYDLMESGADYKNADIDRMLNNVAPHDICSILFTSGSTAFPKGVMHNHISLLGIAVHWLGKTFNLNSSHKLLCYFPIYHIAGSVYYILGALVIGASVFLNEFRPEEILQIIEEENINVFVGFEAHFLGIIDSPSYKSRDLTSIKFVMLAAGPDWYDRCQDIFPGVQLVAHNYGFTEGTGVSTSITEADYHIRKNTNGAPWEGIEVKVVDPDTGERVGPNTSGELCLRGWSRFQGYYNDPEETNRAIDKEGFFHSGDYGWIDEKGNVVYRGRYKMMIKSGGENVSEKEVEVVLESLPGVKAVQVIGVPDKKWGEAVTAVIQLEEGRNIEKHELVKFCEDKLAKFKIPKNILFIDGNDWPLLGSGKVDKKSLKEWATSRL